MNSDTRKKVHYVVVAGAACLLTMAPGAMAQSGTGGSEQSTGNRPTHTQPGSGTDTMDRGRGGTTDRSGSMSNTTGEQNDSMNSRGAKQGDASRIRRVQEALKSEGHDPGAIDGVMGPKTKEALRAFQKQENLQQTGRLDQETMSKLGV